MMPWCVEQVDVPNNGVTWIPVYNYISSYMCTYIYIYIYIYISNGSNILDTSETEIYLLQNFSQKFYAEKDLYTYFETKAV
jgi:hypothetical protein